MDSSAASVYEPQAKHFHQDRLHAPCPVSCSSVTRGMPNSNLELYQVLVQLPNGVLVVSTHWASSVLLHESLCGPSYRVVTCIRSA